MALSTSDSTEMEICPTCGFPSEEITDASEIIFGVREYLTYVEVPKNFSDDVKLHRPLKSLSLLGVHVKIPAWVAINRDPASNINSERRLPLFQSLLQIVSTECGQSGLAIYIKHHSSGNYTFLLLEPIDSEEKIGVRKLLSLVEMCVWSPLPQHDLRVLSGKIKWEAVEEYADNKRYNFWTQAAKQLWDSGISNIVSTLDDHEKMKAIVDQRILQNEKERKLEENI